MKKPLYIRTCHKALKLLLILMSYFFCATVSAGSLSQKVGYEAYIQADSVRRISSAVLKLSSTSSNLNSDSLLRPDYTIFDYLLNRNSALNFVSYFARLAPPTISCPGNIASSTDPGLCKATTNGLAATINDPDGDITTLTWAMNGATSAVSPLTGINNILGSFDFNRGVTTVTYKVTDAIGSSVSCSFTVTVSDTEKPLIVCPANANITIPSCALLTDTITFSALSVSDNCGILNFSSNAPVKFPPGITTVLWSVNDINGNSNQCTQTVTVTNGPPMQIIIISQTNVTCSGSATGSVTVEGNGGTLPYQYSINDGAFQANGTFNNLSAGTYNIIVKDASNCTSSLSVTITQPATLLAASITSQTNVLCSGQANGSATVSATGGNPPYIYSWNTAPVQTTATAINLTARAYTVTVTDASGCTKTASVTITQPTPISIVITTTNVACFGDSTGTAIALASGGTPPYSYAWLTDPIQTTASISNLPADNYILAVSDSQGCFKPAFVTISQPDSQFTTSITNQVNVLCAGSKTGSLTATGIGGIPPYQYSLNGGTFQASGIFNSLSAGVYAIDARDANSCTVNLSATITEPANPLTALITGQTNVLCAGQSNGSATVTASGGTAPYTYSWNTTPVQTTDTATNLTAGNYTVSVTDAAGCLITADVTITQPTPVILTTAKTDILCSGDLSGTATVQVGGGTPPYTYIWITTPVQSTATVTNLAAGNYIITVFDALGCFKSASVTINEPATKLTASITAQSNILCTGQADGSATVTASGGTAPYMYSWNTIPVQITATATNLLSGTYIVTTTDNNGCFDTDTVIITEPASALTGSITSQVDYDCLSGTNGSVTVAGSGGTPGYQYSFDGGAFQPFGTFNNLPVGNYTVTVKDTNNCQVTVPVTIIISGLVQAENDTITATEDTPVNGNVMTNDQLLCNLPIVVTSNTVPLHGFAIVNPDGSFTYTPSLNYNGPDSFTYTLTDNVGGTSTATVFVLIGPVNDSPVLFTESLTVNYNLPKTGNVLLNGDYDPDSTALIVNTTPILDPVNGTFVIAADGSFTYTPVLNYIGTDIVVVNLCDMGTPLPVLCGNDTIFITVLPPNQPPLTNNETLNVCNDAPFIGTLLNGGTVFNGETDPENNLPITVKNILVQSPAHGVFSITDTVSGTFNYTPAIAYSGPDFAIVSICDSGIPVECSNDTVYFEVFTPIIANAGISQTVCNSTVASLVGNSPEPGTGSWAFVSGPNIPTVLPSTSNVAIVTGMISSPIPYVFSYMVTNGNCVSVDTMSVTACTLAAVADYDTTLVNSPVTIQVLANDINPDSIQLTMGICGFPAHGIVSVNSNNTITYSPYSDYEGDDEFCYKICVEAQPLLCVDNMVYIHVKQPSLNDLYVYNGISPNNDGFNDVWKIRGIEKYPDNTVLIFNRWGDKLREFSGYNNTSRSWDGKNEKGQVMPDGTYFYTLDVKNVGVLKGWIYLRGQK